MNDHKDAGDPAERALETMKHSMGQAITGAEDALERVGEEVAAVAHAAEDYRAKMFEYMRANVNAALDYAANLTSVTPSVGLVGLVAAKIEDADAETRVTSELTPGQKAAEEYRTRMFDMMKSNINAALDYAEKLSAVKTPSEFIELSTSHARKQFENVTRQTTELGSLAHKLTGWNSEALGAFTKLFTPPKG